ncbi:alpha/beta hydrolase family protein [Flavivirga algicola]|uniref:Alpha/beta hydrolase n=1 Tax=Flavivirga algicola TaxID=2729136 RepID=A0ABX1S4L4_9FLAO|nr:alpha/beta hydrolase [Flavivirga algicola]NMH89602.1 alpha/beta hydrolase [Flavivirga algicola]
MNKTLNILFTTLIAINTYSQNIQELLDFEFEGIKLSGVLNLPTDLEPKGIVLIVHGDGKTNAVEGNWWYDVRMAILKSGYATYMWDKIGCGNSGGSYKNGRSIENESLEVIAAIKHLKENKIKGSKKIGLWGISRAGWINPTVIDEYKNIAFWISVSGVDDDETFKYLLEQNLRINIKSKDSIKIIMNEWHNSILLSRGGASYKYYLSKTKNLRENEFWKKITNGGISEKSYYEHQKNIQNTTLDKESELPLYVENFEQMLSKIKIPVLALFGEKDMTVDWTKTKTLYEKTLRAKADLKIETFPNCNHNMWQAKTGAIYEFEDKNWKYVRCDGFLDSITNWLNQLK